jgi:translation initiation factor 3 subunit A
VTPWFRFLWESHRSVLEILRTNPKLEALYAMAAGRAFNFCLTYKRNAEFRRLCDILRQHLANMQKYRDTRDITAPESWSLHLETRFEQLRVACELEMWGEAFRSVEDIQNLITLGKRQPKQQLLASYYSRLTQIFKVSNAQLYHAFAWLKLLQFSRSYNKSLTPADIGMMATSVVLATLSVPAYDRALFGRQDDLAAEQEKERTLRMANILGFPVVCGARGEGGGRGLGRRGGEAREPARCQRRPPAAPARRRPDPRAPARRRPTPPPPQDKRADAKSILSRTHLVSSINSMNLLALVPPEVRAAYELLTQDFAPLELAGRLEPLLTQISDIKVGGGEGWRGLAGGAALSKRRHGQSAAPPAACHAATLPRGPPSPNLDLTLAPPPVPTRTLPPPRAP